MMMMDQYIQNRVNQRRVHNYFWFKFTGMSHPWALRFEITDTFDLIGLQWAFLVSWWLSFQKWKQTSFTGYHTVGDRDDRPTHAELERKLSDPINYKIYTATLESEETMGPSSEALVVPTCILDWVTRSHQGCSNDSRVVVCPLECHLIKLSISIEFGLFLYRVFTFFWKWMLAYLLPSFLCVFFVRPRLNDWL